MGVSTSALEYSQFGIDNTSAAPVTIECPLPLSFNGNAIANVTAASAVAYDRNTTSDVVCSLQVVNSLGNVLQSFNAQTSGGGPGSNFQPLTFPVSQAISSNYWRLHCTLPAIQSGALSHLTTYGLDTNE
jgi:hypothetical protein